MEALRLTMNAQYPQGDFADLWISPEYPFEKSSYPGIFITYEDSDPVEIAGIDHKEYIANLDGTFSEITRYRFFGTLSFTCVALSSRERDRLYDELIRIMAFARVENSVSTFRKHIEDNDFVGMNLSFDVLRPSGDAAGAGTPWETQEIIYEKTLSIDLIGDFASTPDPNSSLVALSKVLTQGYYEGEPAPQFPDTPVTLPNQPWSPNEWH